MVGSWSLTMKCSTFKVFTAFLLIASGLSSYADAVWTSSTSGLWRDAAKWSGGILPNQTSVVQLTNSGTKSVTIDAFTASTNLAINRITIGAPVGFTNTLALLDLSSQVFRSFYNVAVNRGGAVTMKNSSLYVAPDLGGTFNIFSGSATLDGGLLDCSQVTLRVGRANTGPGVLTTQSGTVLADTLLVGETSGARGTLNVYGGAVIASSLLSFGETAGSIGSGFITGGNLAVTNGFLIIGNVGAGQVSVSGGTVQCLSEVHIADTLSSTGMLSMVGGVFSATNDITAIGRQGLGEMTVTNAVASLTNVSVGRHSGSRGILTVQSNALVTLLADLSIGRFLNSTGTVVVSGGELSSKVDAIWVGREGSGHMTVSNGLVQALNLRVALSNASSGTLNIRGGRVMVGSDFVIGNPLISTGQVLVTGGTVAVTNSAGTGALSLQSGSLSLAGGTLTVDNLRLTNGNGQFSFANGKIQTRATTVNNGAPFTIGDGTNAATFELIGGTHSFANGLIISSNAVLTGCGTIIGTVINNGRMLNCSPVITSIAKNGASASVSFTTSSGKTYRLHSTDSLSTPNWTLVSSNIVGTGSIVTVIDSNAVLSPRFYRVQMD